MSANKYYEGCAESFSEAGAQVQKRGIYQYKAKYAPIIVSLVSYS